MRVCRMINGREVYDPRRHRYVMSSNPALVFADFWDASGRAVDWADVAKAADYCDEYVTIPEIEVSTPVAQGSGGGEPAE